MRASDLSLREKVLQIVVLRTHGNFNSTKAGGASIFGKIITQADEMGLANARKIIQQYIDNADIPIMLTSDFEIGCGDMLKGLTPFPYMMALGGNR